MPQPATAPPAVAGRIVGQSPLQIWSLNSSERLARQLRRAGATATEAAAGRVVLLRADWVFDEPLVKGLARQDEGCAMVNEAGECVALVLPPARADEGAALLAQGQGPVDLPRRSGSEIAGSYNDQLRKREPPFLLPLQAGTLPAIESRVFAGSYKGVTDFVTLYLWPRPARAFTRVCARFGIAPNTVTTASLVLVLLAMWAFWQGQFAWGLVAAWGMTFLDTVDGKLARVTLNSSKFGDLYDHLIDLLHPPFWWWAWVVGLGAAGLALPEGSLALTVIVAGYILQRLEEGIFIARYKMDMHVWQRFDSKLRLVTARRNPNLAILTVSVILGRPDIGIQVVAVWVAICLVLHAIRIVQAESARRRGPLKSWLS